MNEINLYKILMNFWAELTNQNNFVTTIFLSKYFILLNYRSFGFTPW